MKLGFSLSLTSLRGPGGADVALPLVNTILPAITGTARIGEILTADTGTWTGSPTGHAYQWQRGGVDIAEATAPTHALVTADAGTAITVRVTATNAGGATATATSAATAPVAVAEPVDLLAGTASLRFPEGNNTADGSVLPALNTYKGALIQATAGATLPASTTPHATYAILRLPKEQRYWNCTFGILGNSGSSGRTWRLRVGGQGAPLSGTTRNVFNLYQRSSSGGTANVNSAVWDEDACLVVAGVDAAGAFYIDWYSLIDGTLHAGARSVVATNSVTLLNNLFSVGANGIATAFANNGAGGTSGTVNWPGEIAAVGVVQRDVSTADWQAIALGADITTVLGAANMTYARAFDGTAASFGPVAGTADTQAALAPVAGGAGIPPSTLVPGSTLRRQSAAQWLLMDQVAPGHVYGLTVGQAGRAVPFAGTAGGLAGTVEVRVFRADTGAIVQDWAAVGAISGGVWAGTLTLPRSSGWLFAQARAAAAPAVIFDRRMEFAVGWKFVLIGQSQMSISFGGPASLVPLGTPMSATWVGNDPSPSPSHVQVARIGMGMADFSAAETTMRAGTNAFVNQFRVFDPDTPIMLIDEAVNGSGMTQIIDSASPENSVNGRNMNQLTRKLAVVGNDVSAVVHNWYTSDAGAGYAGFQERLDALFYGTGPQAADRNLTAELAPGWVPVMSPGTRDSRSAAHNRVIEAAVAWANARDVTVGPVIADLRIEDAGGPHETAQMRMGSALMMQRMAIAAARAMGLDPSRNPYFTTAALTDGGATITIQTVRPNGGSLYSPTPNALRYFDVSTDGGATFSFTGFSAAILGNTVVLTKASGTWAAGTVVAHDLNGPPRDNGDGPAEDAIVNGMLYETWAGDVIQSPPRGLPFAGTLSGGKWVAGWQVTL